MIKHVKDKSRLVGRKRVCPHHARPHYWFVYLWETREAMLQNTGHPMGENTIAMHCPKDERIVVPPDGGEPERKPYPMIGEMHFVRGRWNTEIAFHEATHGILHFYRALGAGGDYFQELLDGDDGMEREEEFCYLSGKLADLTHRVLWRMDPRDE